MDVFFLPAAHGRRFCIHYPAADAGSGWGIVYIHPFGEEMNKARRMAALEARRLAASGRAVLQIDLFGCGDSAGDFGDARWATWVEDVRVAVAWMRGRGATEIGLWGLRLGTALAVEVAADASAGIRELILWQPVANGEQFLTQFLRLQLAAEMLAGGAAQSGVRGLRAALAAGSTLEIGGYDLHPDLAASIDRVKLAAPAPSVARVHWLEVSARPAPEITPGSRRVVEAWRARGLDVRAAAVEGEPFWSTVEIAHCAALLDATDAALSGLP